MTSIPLRSKPQGRSSGMTLLEMLLVMMILGLVVALIGPRMTHAIDSAQRATAWRAFEQSLVELPRQTALAGRYLELASNTDLGHLPSGRSMLRLPDGATFSAQPPWRIGPQGACEASNIRVTWGEEARSYRVQSPACQLIGLVSP